MDQMGEVEYAPGEPKGTPWHPHRGFETVTYMIDGTFQHQDSNGGGGLITNGDTQWMTAGGGILHIETPPEELVTSGGLFHGIQLWVNLPRRQDDRPALPGHPSRRGGAALARRTAARWSGSSPATSAGHAGPGSTHTPIILVHATLQPGARLRLPWRSDFNALVYVLAGSRHGRRRAAPGPHAASWPSSAPATRSPWRPRRRGRTRTRDARRPDPRRPAHPRAGRRLRTVRDEHPGRDRPGLRGLPGRPARQYPGPARRGPGRPHPGHDVL